MDAMGYFSIGISKKQKKIKIKKSEQTNLFCYCGVLFTVNTSLHIKATFFAEESRECHGHDKIVQTGTDENTRLLQNNRRIRV